MIDVFISYSSKDKIVADAVCHALEENRVMCWIAPRDVIVGQSYAKQIMQSIKECQVIVLIFSENSNKSEHVENEIDKGFNCGKPIIPFLIDRTEMNDELGYYLGRKHWLVAYPDYRQKTADLVASVLRLIGRNRPQMEEGPECVPIKMIPIEGGTFEMGASLEQGKDADESEKPRHKVTLSSFEISEAPITVAQYREFCEKCQKLHHGVGLITILLSMFHGMMLRTLQNGKDVDFQPKQNGNLQQEVAIFPNTISIAEVIPLMRLVGLRTIQDKRAPALSELRSLTS